MVSDSNNDVSKRDFWKICGMLSRTQDWKNKNTRRGEKNRQTEKKNRRRRQI